MNAGNDWPRMHADGREFGRRNLAQTGGGQIRTEQIFMRKPGIAGHELISELMASWPPH
jgi:hypothetical protein